MKLSLSSELRADHERHAVIVAQRDAEQVADFAEGETPWKAFLRSLDERLDLYLKVSR